MAARVRISQVRGASTPPALVRVSSITVNNAAGDVYLLRAGTWQPRYIHVRVAGVWTVI